METVKDRLVQYLQARGIGMNRFERLAGISNGYIANLKSTPGVDKVELILKASPGLSKVWLLTGEGEMMVAEDAREQELCDLREEIAYLKKQNERLMAIIDKLLGK